MMLFRLPVLVGLFLLLALAPFARAQETDTTLLTQAAEQTASASAYQFNFTLRLDVSGIPGGGIVLDLNGSGALTQGDGGLALDLTLNGTGHIGTRPAPTSVRARVIDGIFYFNLPGSERWSGARVDELVPLVEDVMVSNFIRGFTSGGVSLMPGTGAAGSTNDPTVRAAFDRVAIALDQIDVSRFAAIQRLPDETFDGRQTAHFVSQIALADLVRSDEAVALLVDLVRVGNPAQPDLSDTERAAVGAQFARIFSQASLTLDQYPGLDDGYLHRWSAHGDILLDPTTLGNQGNAVHLGLDFDARLSAFDQPVTIEVPPNAFVITGLASALGLNRTVKPDEQIAPTAPVSVGALPGQPIAANTPTVVSVADGAPAELVYQGRAGETISVIARSLEDSGSLDLQATVLDSSNFQIAQNDDNTGSRPNLQPFDSVIEGLTLPNTGEYLIRVNTFSAAQGRAEVTVESTAPPTEIPTPTATATVPPTPVPTLPPTATLAPTATAAPPQVISLSDRIPEQGSYGYDFSAAAGQVMTVTVHATGELDPKVSLIGPDGVLVAENDDHEDADSTLNSRDARILTAPAAQTGTYHLQIVGFAGTGGPFDLTVAVETPPAPTPVPTAAAGPLSHQEVSGQISAGQTFDANFSAQAGDVYTLTAESTGGDLDSAIDLLDAGGNVVESSDNHGSSDPTLSATDARIDNWIAPVDGIYTVRVSGARDTSGAVTLALDKLATGAPLAAGQDQLVTGQVQPNNLFTLTIDAQAGDYLTITVRSLSADLDPQVTLLDAGGTVLADNDDHSMADATLADVDARIHNFHVPATGAYTVQVTGFNNTGGSFALAISTLR